MLRLAVTVSRNINKARTALFINTPAYGIMVITLLDGPQNLEIPNLTPFMQDAEKKNPSSFLTNVLKIRAFRQLNPQRSRFAGFQDQRTSHTARTAMRCFDY